MAPHATNKSSRGPGEDAVDADQVDIRYDDEGSPQVRKSSNNRNVKKNRNGAEVDIDNQMRMQAQNRSADNNSKDDYADAIDDPAGLRPSYAPNGGNTPTHVDPKTGIAYNKRTSTNEDGKVHVNLLNAPDWMKQALQKLDEDNDGLSQDELLQWLDAIANQKRAHEANSDEIDYTLMPEKVQAVMRKWDG